MKTFERDQRQSAVQIEKQRLDALMERNRNYKAGSGRNLKSRKPVKS